MSDSTKGCLVCRHPKAKAISSALISGGSQRKTAEAFGVSKTSIQRHAENCLTNAIQRKPIGSAELSRSVAPRLEALYGKIENVLTEAEQSRNVDTLLKAATELRRNLELAARLSGELRDGGPTINLDLRKQEQPPAVDWSRLTEEQRMFLDRMDPVFERMGLEMGVAKILGSPKQLPTADVLTIEAAPEGQ